MTFRKQNTAARVFDHVKAFPLATAQEISLALEIPIGSSSSLLSQLSRAGKISATPRPNANGRIVGHYRADVPEFFPISRDQPRHTAVTPINIKQTVAQLIDALSVKEARTAYLLLGELFSPIPATIQKEAA